MAAPESPRTDELPRTPTPLPGCNAAHTGIPDASADIPDDSEHDTDERLVEAARAGNHRAFETLYERYFPRVFRFLDRRLRNRADTEDTVQEVFVNVFASIESFRGEAPFGAWVFGVTRRTLAARFKRKRHAIVPLPDGDIACFDLLLTSIRREPDPIESYEAKERLSRMDEAVRCDLTREQWRLFQLHHLEKRSIHDIACLLDKSEDAVKSNLYRARKLLLAR